MNAPEKALPHVVTGLISKRAELAGRIEHLQAQVRQVTVELDHIEASIRIFQPDIDMETLGIRPVPAIHHAFKGETTRVVLETIRKAGRPVDTTTITEAVMKARGLDRQDAAKSKRAVRSLARPIDQKLSSTTLRKELPYCAATVRLSVPLSPFSTRALFVHKTSKFGHCYSLT